MSEGEEPDGNVLDPGVGKVYSRAAGRLARLQTELAREGEDFGLATTDPERLFGPNWGDVIAVLGALPTIQVGFAWAIAYACHSVPQYHYVAAQATVKKARRGGCGSELWMAEHEVSDWLASLHLSGEPLKLYEVVARAATNAVDAIILEKEVSDADFTALYWPWSQVVDSQAPGGPAIDRRRRMSNQWAKTSTGQASVDGPDATGSPSDPSRSELLAELDREAEEFDTTTIDPIERYGPHGEDVEALMVALDDIRSDDITSDDLLQLENAWKSIDAEAAVAVLSAVKGYRTRGKYVEFLDAAEMDVDAWQRAVSATGKDAELDRVVVEAARDAIDALILQDELDDAEFDLLYGPWADVIDPIEEEGFTANADEPAVGEATESSAAPDEGFGPNAPAVRAFLATLSELCADDFKDLTAAFNRQPKSELKRAHGAVHDLVDTDRSRRDSVVAAQDWVTSYLRPTREMMNGAVTDLRISSSTPTVDRLLVDKAIALPPAIDAVTALVLGDLLDPEGARTLLAPWVEVVERGDEF